VILGGKAKAPTTPTPMRNQHPGHPDWYFDGSTLPVEPEETTEEESPS
jgi:hypothetical protein